MSSDRELDANGRMVLIGLSYDETKEFDALDDTSPVDQLGKMTWRFEGGPRTRAERRWLFLYEKHRLAMAVRRLRNAH